MLCHRLSTGWRSRSTRWYWSPWECLSSTIAIWSCSAESQSQAVVEIPADCGASRGPRRERLLSESDSNLLTCDRFLTPGVILVRGPLHTGTINLRSRFAAVLLASAAASAQVMVDPARLPASLKNFERKQNQPSVRCEVTPVKPTLDYGFRFSSGYVVRVPLNQYPGSGHRLTMLARVAPLGADRQAAYLINVVRLPNIPPTKLGLEVAGFYLLGQGKYNVEWALLDETNRA